MPRTYVTDDMFFAWCDAFDQVGGFSGLTAQAAVDAICAAIADHVSWDDDDNEMLDTANGVVIEVFANCIFEYCEDADTLAPSDAECTYQLAAWDGKHLYETHAYTDADGDAHVEATWRGCTSAKGGA